MTHLDKLREESDVIADVLEDNEDEIRHCSGDCSDCPHGKFQTCFN